MNLSRNLSKNPFKALGENLFKTNFIFCPLFFSVLQFPIATYIRRSIKQYFHYMRVREIMDLTPSGGHKDKWDITVRRGKDGNERQRTAGIPEGVQGRSGSTGTKA
jgi:hypothetical protein